MPNPIKLIDEQGMEDLARRILLARAEEVREEARLLRARELAAKSRQAASTHRRATLAHLDEFRAVVPSGEALAAFLRKLEETRSDQRRAEAVESEHARAYMGCREALRKARAKVAALLDEDMPLFAAAHLNGPAEAPSGEAAPKTKPTRRRRVR